MTFQWNFFLISHQTLPWHNLRPFPLIFSLETWQNKLVPTSLRPPFASPVFWNESSAGPQITPLNPPQTPSVAGWDSKPCIFLSLQQQDPGFLMMFSAACLGQCNQSKQQTHSQTPPSLDGLHGGNISFHCPILPPSTSGSAVRPAQSRQHLLPRLLRLGKLVLLAHRPSTSTSLFNKLKISTWIWSHRVHGLIRENIKSREHKKHKWAKEQQVQREEKESPNQGQEQRRGGGTWNPTKRYCKLRSRWGNDRAAVLHHGAEMRRLTVLEGMLHCLKHEHSRRKQELYTSPFPTGRFQSNI